MATTSWPVPLRIPEARLLADLVGVEQDLTFVRDVCRHLENLSTSPPQDDPYFIGEALTIAAVVRYGRCFKGGVRDKQILIEIVQELSPTQRRLHGIVLALRDKHIAHSVNSLEENLIGAMVSDNPTQTAVRSISTGHSRFAALGGSSLRRFRELVEHLLRQVLARVKAEKAQVLAAAQRLDFEDLRRQGLAGPL